MKLNWPHLTWTKSSWPAHHYRARSGDRWYELYAEGSLWRLSLPNGGSVRRQTAAELQQIADDVEKGARS